MIVNPLEYCRRKEGLGEHYPAQQHILFVTQLRGSFYGHSNIDTFHSKMFLANKLCVFLTCAVIFSTAAAEEYDYSVTEIDTAEAIKIVVGGLLSLLTHVFCLGVSLASLLSHWLTLVSHNTWDYRKKIQEMNLHGRKFWRWKFRYESSIVEFTGKEYGVLPQLIIQVNYSRCW